jgi:hypothetical protein
MPNNHHTEEPNTKTLMASNLSRTQALLASNRLMVLLQTANSHLTADPQAINNLPLEVFNIRIPTEATKGPRPCSNIRHLQIIKEVQDMVAPPLLQATLHSLNINTFKDCTMLSTQVVCMATAAAHLLFPRAPIRTKARMHLNHLNMVHLQTSTEDNKDGNLTRILRSQGEKVMASFRDGICIY